MYISWSNLGDELEVIINKTQLHNILEDREDRHLSSVDSLSVAQLKDELTTRGLPAKGKKAALVARLKEALGPNTKVCHIHMYAHFIPLEY